MMCRLSIAILIFSLAGCSATAPRLGPPALPFVTKETGQITLSRDEAITVLAQTQVLYRAWSKDAKIMCEAGLRSKEWCARLPAIDEEMKVVSLKAEAKLAHPEAELDYEHIISILSLLAKLVL